MSDKIDWRTLKVGEHVTVTFDAVVSDIHDGLWVIAEGSPAMPTRFLVAEADKATITKKEQPLKVGDRVLDGADTFVGGPGTVLGIDGDDVWVRWDDPQIGACTSEVTDLTRVKD